MADNRPLTTLILRPLNVHLDDGTELVAQKPCLYEVVGLPSGQWAGMFRREQRWNVVLSRGHGRYWNGDGDYATAENALAAIQTELSRNGMA